MSPFTTLQVYGSIRDIALSLQNQIATFCELDKNAVFITRSNDVPHFVRDAVVVIWVRGETPDGHNPPPGGRTNCMRMRRLTLLIYSRVLLDTSDRDTDRLTDWALGQMGFEDQVFDAVELFFPQDNAQNLISDAPMYCGAMSEPMIDGKNPEYTRTELEILVPYNRILTQRDQFGQPL
jgi:hypothetical protein